MTVQTATPKPKKEEAKKKATPKKTNKKNPPVEKMQQISQVVASQNVNRPNSKKKGVARTQKKKKGVKPNVVSHLASNYRVPLRSPYHKLNFDLRDRGAARSKAFQLLRAFPRSPVARAMRLALSRGGDEKGKLVGVNDLGRCVKLTFVDFPEPGDELAPLANEDYNASAAHEIDVMGEHHVPVPHKQNANILKSIEDEMVHDKLETNGTAGLYLNSLLDPCGAPNIGVPDEENRALSGKPRVRTVYLLPMQADEAYVKITRNPAKHIIIEDAGAAVTFNGPKWTCTTGAATAGKKQWSVAQQSPQLENSFATPNATTAFSVAAGAGIDRYVDTKDNDNVADYEVFSVPNEVEKNPPTNYFILPCAVGDVFSVFAWTDDTTSNNYIVQVDWATNNAGTRSITTASSSAITGSGSAPDPSIAASFTAPANTVGVLQYRIINQGGSAATTELPAIQTSLAMGTGPLVYPFGSSDLEDLNFLQTYAQDIRTVGCRVTCTYVAKKLEGGYIVGGQLPMTGDDVFPEGTLSQLAVIPGMKPRPLNGVSPGISFPLLPMSKESADFHPLESLFDDDDFGEGAIQIVTTGADANLIILQTELSLQYRSELQVLMQTTGVVDLQALADVQSYLADIGPLAFVTGNDEHQAMTDEVVTKFKEERPTFSFLNGNSISVNLSPW
jgi:hypothetical protein